MSDNCQAVRFELEADSGRIGLLGLDADPDAALASWFVSNPAMWIDAPLADFYIEIKV